MSEICECFFWPAMDSDFPCVLVLSGKSSQEVELSRALKSSSTLKLPDNGEVKVLLDSEREKQLNGHNFHGDLFLNLLTTDQFGRFVIWSPRIPSTHDIISQ